jgi:DNA-directed RNA polymerase beta' subunit
LLKLCFIKIVFHPKLLKVKHSAGNSYPAMANSQELLRAHAFGRVGIHAKVILRVPKDMEVVETDRKYRAKEGRIVTTAGRIILNDILPEGMPFYNYPLSQKGCQRVISDCYQRLGKGATLDLLDGIKELGFKHSTLAGLSFGVTDLRIPDRKNEILARAQARVDRIQADFQADAITDGERQNQIVDVWIHAREEITKSLLETLKSKRLPTDPANYLNPVWLMSDSGARGNIDQIRQLAGMRGLMSKPSGEIIETPIKANFREGLTVLEYFSSTHGARKGLADTALKTADSGYLTRKLADVAQNVIVNQIDCGTLKGIPKTAIYKGEQVDVPLREIIVGRTARENIVNPITDETIVKENQVITAEAARKIEDLGLESIRVRSPLTCESPLGVCAKCYGNDLSTARLVEEGLAVGIIGAQSIGEPGTQLTMRTFHTGGVATRAVMESEVLATVAGTIRFRDLNAVEVKVAKAKQLVVLKRNGEIAIVDEKNRELEKYKVPYGATVLAPEGATVKPGTRLVTWDPHRVPILAEASGIVEFEDIEEGETVRVESERTGKRYVVVEHKGEKHPRIVIRRPGRDADYSSRVETLLQGVVSSLHPKFGVREKPGALIIKEVEVVANFLSDPNTPWWSDPDDQTFKKRFVPRKTKFYGIIFFRPKRGDVSGGFIGKANARTTDLYTVVRDHVRSAGTDTAQFAENMRVNLKKEWGRIPSQEEVAEHITRNFEFTLYETGYQTRDGQEGQILDFHYLPSKARVEVEEGQQVEPGELLARQPREISGTQDITAGLPRVTEIFEARKPKEPAAMAEISGRVELRTDKRRGKMTIIVRSESGMEQEHHVPHDRHLLVHTGDFVEAGDPLTEGPLVPHDILRIRGEEHLQQYLLSEVQGVYRAAGVSINDKHIEVIVSQMLRKVKVDQVGDSNLLPGDVVDKFRFLQENTRLDRSMRILEPGDTEFAEGQIVPREKVEQANMEVEGRGGQPAKTKRPRRAAAKTMLLGVTKASLQSESFLSAASFQESTKVFTEAALSGKVDELRGLKENVILGHLIPAGTSFKPYLDMKIKKFVDLPDLVPLKDTEELTEAQKTQAVQQALTGQD